MIVKRDELKKYCEAFVVGLPEKALVLLEGDLGAGKTTFVQECVSVLAPDVDVDSPTFSIINEYKRNDKASIYHVDLYRLEDSVDIESSGFWDLFEKDQALIFVEWPSRVPEDEWPLTWPKWRVQLLKNDESDARCIEINKVNMSVTG